MTSPEPARHALYGKLEHVLGPDHADTLMTYLPQNSSDEAATKSDIAALKSDIEELKHRFDRLEDIVRDQQKVYVATVVGSMTALTGIFSVVVGLLT